MRHKKKRKEAEKRMCTYKLNTTRYLIVHNMFPRFMEDKSIVIIWLYMHTYTIIPWSISNGGVNINWNNFVPSFHVGSWINSNAIRTSLSYQQILHIYVERCYRSFSVLLAPQLVHTNFTIIVGDFSEKHWQGRSKCNANC